MAQLDEETINFIRFSTRESQFDFDKVSAMLQTFIQTTGRILNDADMTPEKCREYFAGDYYSDNVSKALRVEEISSKTSLHNLSFNEMLVAIEKMEEESTRHKEKVFSRVLASLLGGDDENGATAASITEFSPEMNLIFNTMNEAKVCFQ